MAGIGKGGKIMLRECPFCKNTNVVLDYLRSSEQRYVRCPRCGACGPDARWDGDDGADEWNARAYDAEIAALRMRVEELERKGTVVSRIADRLEQQLDRLK